MKLVRLTKILIQLTGALIELHNRQGCRFFLALTGRIVEHRDRTEYR